MSVRRIDCVTKKDGRIDMVGGPWGRQLASVVISEIDTGINKYCVTADPGPPATVIPVETRERNGRKYLVTVKDGKVTDNLDNLRSC